MVTHKATITRESTNTSLNLLLEGMQLEINLTDEKPNEIKNIFNQLLLELKKGEFNFELEDNTEDLFFHISSEYILQLNAELSSIYKEFESYGLLEVKTT